MWFQEVTAYPSEGGVEASDKQGRRNRKLREPIFTHNQEAKIKLEVGGC